MRRQGRAPEKGEGERAGRVGGGKGEREEEGLRIRGRKRRRKGFYSSSLNYVKEKRILRKGTIFHMNINIRYIIVSALDVCKIHIYYQS